MDSFNQTSHFKSYNKYDEICEIRNTRQVSIYFLTKMYK